MQFRIEFSPTKGLTWPCVSIQDDCDMHGPFAVTVESRCIELDLDVSSSVCIHYHKLQQETVVEHGKIVADQTVRICRCWVDDVLMESWFLTECYYEPVYFAGFSEQNPLSESSIKSQLLWHFPGRFTIKFAMPFWDWYQQQRHRYHRFNHTDKDQERWENYTGSQQAHADLVNEIYGLLDAR